MNIQKITTIIVTSLGVLGAVFVLMIVGKGDDAIEMSAMQGDFGSVTPIILIAILITVVFSIKNLASDKGKLKSSLMAIGAFLLVLVVAYLFSSGEETPMQDGAFLSANGARWVEAGIRMFYFLTVIAIASMSYGSIRKLIKK